MIDNGRGNKGGSFPAMKKSWTGPNIKQWVQLSVIEKVKNSKSVWYLFVEFQMNEKRKYILQKCTKKTDNAIWNWKGEQKMPVWEIN